MFAPQSLHAPALLRAVAQSRIGELGSHVVCGWELQMRREVDSFLNGSMANRITGRQV